MQYFRDTLDVSINEPTAITLGKFDGVHRGHTYLIAHLRKLQKEKNLKSVIFTFVKPPKDEIEQAKHEVLSTIEEKERIFNELHIDYVIEYPFSKEVMNMEAVDFIEFLVRKLNVKAIVVGDDFHFGKGRQGNTLLLEELKEEYGYELIVVKKKQYAGEDISSTLIREKVKEGEIEIANDLLGYEYFMEGVVGSGNRIGTKIGVPTINLILPPQKLLPPIGVYASKIYIDDERYYGITNVGNKPTIGDFPVGVETNIFDYQGDLYGKTVRVTVGKYIRGEKKFGSTEELRDQIMKDVKILQSYYKKLT